ncbi:MAG: alpha-ribazole phosphatase [Phocaeicola sp.]
MTLYFVRHTAVDVPAGICYGQMDVPLKESFEAEASVVHNQLYQHQFEAVYSSPLSRCLRLAHFCGYKEVKRDDRLKELHFGDWEGKAWSEIDMSVWSKDWVHPSVPGGESFEQMYKRVASFLADLEKSGLSSVLVFAHSGVIRCAKLYFERMALERAFEFEVEYGEVVIFQR